jgi:hypothetical protein
MTVASTAYVGADDAAAVADINPAVAATRPAKRNARARMERG